MVSSFSFRAMQNGVAFFLVFAIGVAGVAKEADLKPAGRTCFRSLLATVIAFAVLTLIYCGAKLGSEYYLLSGDHAGDRDAATALYEQGLRLDPDNANVRLALGSLYAQRNDNQRAAASMRSAIDRGLGTTPTYGLLAEQQRLAGASAAALETFREGLKVFPASIYLRVAYSVTLEDEGEQDEANEQMRIARSIDGRDANGWYSLIRDGSTAAFYKAQADPETAPPAELSPHNAVLPYLDKTP
jgi:tetratricopeptide (TPR) repeat protein